MSTGITRRETLKAEPALTGGGSKAEHNPRTESRPKTVRTLPLAPILIGAIMLVVTINGLLYIKGSSMVKAHARILSTGGTSATQLGDLQRWNMTITVTSLLTGVGLAALSTVGFSWWRKSLLAQVSQQLETSLGTSGRLDIMRSDLERL